MHTVLMTIPSFILQKIKMYCKELVYEGQSTSNAKSEMKQDLYEPRCEKPGLLGFRPGPTQTGLYSHRRWLEA